MTKKYKPKLQRIAFKCPKCGRDFYLEKKDYFLVKCSCEKQLIQKLIDYDQDPNYPSDKI